MTRVLLIKTSSLGDVIHCLPAVSDMAGQVPDLRLEWVIEEGLVEIARLHPAVERAIPVRLRAWRHNLFSSDTREEFGVFHRAISLFPYDRVIDAQGLIRSAMLARLAKGPHCGYDAASVREPPASLLYDRKFPASITIHAAERTRQLAGQAMGYSTPAEVDYGVRIPAVRPDWLEAERYIVGLHGTARADKAWAELHWNELGHRASEAGLTLVLPWGSESERERSGRIAGATGGVIPPRLSFTALAELFAGAAAVVGVDTGLTHLASAVGAPVVAIYAASWAEFNGVIGAGFIANLGAPGEPPDVEAVWAKTEEAVQAGRKDGPWLADMSTPAPELAGRRRFRPAPAGARAPLDAGPVVDRR